MLKPDYQELHDIYIKRLVDEGCTNLLVPIVQGDHWHLLEFDVENDIARHYDSLKERSGHWDPVLNIVKAFNYIKAGFNENQLRSVFDPIKVPCEEQNGS